MIRKRPEGNEFLELCAKWDDSTHQEKIKLADQYKVTLDTMKHWRSDFTGTVVLPKAVEPSNRMTVDDLLHCRPAVNLDFVTFDVETSNLNADFSILLAAVIKPYGCDPIVFRSDAYPTWTTNRADDSAITVDIAKELRKHAIVIGHYSSRFDIKYIRAKMVKHNVEPLPPMFGLDSWKIAIDNFKVSSRRLKNLVNYFDIGDKSGVEGGLWMDAAYNGSREAMDEIVLHNIADCEVLEKLACLIFPFVKSIPRL